MEAANKTLAIVQITDNGGKTNQQAVGKKGRGQKSAGGKVVLLFQRLQSNTSHSTGAPAQGFWCPGKNHRGSPALPLRTDLLGRCS